MVTETDQNGRRLVTVQIELRGGYRHEVILREDAPELQDLFRSMAAHTQPDLYNGDWFFQLPIENGEAACSFVSSQIVAVITKPPVLVDVQLPVVNEQVNTAQSSEANLQNPNYVIVDDFLSHDEQQNLLDYALENESSFEKGTVATNLENYRNNQVILEWGKTSLATHFTNRLLIILPLLMKKLGKQMVALESVECQLTASNDGQFFKNHMDSAADANLAPRELTCVYYFNGEPKNFGGGELRLYDTFEQNGQHWSASSFAEIEPRSNRLVVFPSNRFHELRPIRCPSGLFKDSRFAISAWIRKTDQPDPETRFGWGYFHCGIVPPEFN
jgi:SM-20-related protein